MDAEGVYHLWPYYMPLIQFCKPCEKKFKNSFTFLAIFIACAVGFFVQVELYKAKRAPYYYGARFA